MVKIVGIVKMVRIVWTVEVAKFIAGLVSISMRK